MCKSNRHNSFIILHFSKGNPICRKVKNKNTAHKQLIINLLINYTYQAAISKNNFNIFHPH